MNAVIIAIGDELLIGQTINSNAAWIGQELSLRGFDIQQSLVVKDNEEANSLLKTGEVLIKKINAWERQLIQPDQKTFQDVINFNNKLSSQLMHLKGYIEAVDPAITAGAKERLSDLISTWNVYQNERDDLMNKDMTSFNTQFSALNLPAIIIKD